MHFNGYASHFTLHGLHDEEFDEEFDEGFDEEFVNDVEHPAVIPHAQELELEGHELEQELEQEFDGHEPDELFVVV